MAFSALAVTLCLSVPAFSAPVVHFSDFIANETRSGFSGFEAAPRYGASAWIEDGIRTDQIGGTGGILYGWTAWGAEGQRAWYPNGGDIGYTRITKADGSNFSEVGMLIGDGYSVWAPVEFAYELFLDGVSVLFGTSTSTKPGYLGFSGGGFDEVRFVATSGPYRGSSVAGGVSQAAAIDSIETRDPSPVSEPIVSSLLGLGLLGIAGLRRARKA